jgi:hypothetical protein
MKSVELLKAISRLFAIQFLSFALLELPSLPEYFVMAVDQARRSVNSHTAIFAGAALLFRFFLNLTFAMIFWFGAGLLAKLAGKSLFADASTQRNENIKD